MSVYLFRLLVGVDVGVADDSSAMATVIVSNNDFPGRLALNYHWISSPSWQPMSWLAVRDRFVLK